MVQFANCTTTRGRDTPGARPTPYAANPAQRRRRTNVVQKASRTNGPMKLKAQAKPNPTWQNSSLEPPAKLVASLARNALAQSGERFTIGEVSGPVH